MREGSPEALTSGRRSRAFPGAQGFSARKPGRLHWTALHLTNAVTWAQSRAVWNLAEGPSITVEDAASARVIVEAELDESFFRARIQRSTAEERRYMRAMAELGSDAQKAADVAVVLKKESGQVAPLRARLINKGLLYTPRYGYAKFTVPQFDRFMRRYMDLETDTPPDR